MFEDDKNVFMVMELMKGGELLDRILKHKSLSEREAALIMYTLASTFTFLHEEGVGYMFLTNLQVSLTRILATLCIFSFLPSCRDRVSSREKVDNVNWPPLRVSKRTFQPERRANARNVSFETLNVYQFTLSTQLIIPHYFILGLSLFCLSTLFDCVKKTRASLSINQKLRTTKPIPTWSLAFSRALDS